MCNGSEKLLRSSGARLCSDLAWAILGGVWSGSMANTHWHCVGRRARALNGIREVHFNRNSLFGSRLHASRGLITSLSPARIVPVRIAPIAVARNAHICGLRTQPSPRNYDAYVGSEAVTRAAATVLLQTRLRWTSRAAGRARRARRRARGCCCRGRRAGSGGGGGGGVWGWG